MNELPIKLNLPQGFLDEEERCGYVVKSKMKELWAVELDLLNELDKVCKKNGVKYYAGCGTLLGAARHNGFIPWDDDIDIMMDRHNYDKLCAHSEDFNHPYFFQTEHTDPGTLRGHAQLRNSETTMILESERPGRFSFNQGVFIDIFPLDKVPDDPRKRTKFIDSQIRMKDLIQYVQYLSIHKYESVGIKRLIKCIMDPIIGFLNNKLQFLHNLYIKYENKMKMYNRSNTDHICLLSLAAISKRCIWEKSDFEGGDVVMPFEFMSIPVPSGYENLLSVSYGNWKEYKIDYTNHGGLIVDCNTPYKDYFFKEESSR